MQLDDKILKEILASFKLEMSERQLALSQQLTILEDAYSNASQPIDVENATHLGQMALCSILRELHNLKGAARAANLLPIEELCHAAESVLAPYNPHFVVPTFNIVIDLLYEAISWGDALLGQLNQNGDLELPGLNDFTISLREFGQNQLIMPEPTSIPTIPAAPAAPAAEQSQPALVAVASAEKRVPALAPAPANPGADNSLRISATKLDQLLAASTELLVARLRIHQHREEIAHLLAETQASNRLWRSSARRIHGRLAKRNSKLDRDLSTLLQYVEANQLKLKYHEAALGQLHARFSRNLSYLSSITDQLQFETRRLRLIPLSLVVEELERTLRQLCRDLGKQAQLVVYGTDLELDKKLLDEIKAPLLHLLRNALDHGLESPAARLHANKPAAGTITISFRQAGRSIEVEMRDDGAGVDVERVRQLIVERNLLDEASAALLSREGVFQYLFHSGFSTRREISNLSGRGIGLDSVRETVSRLGGTLSVESWPESGTVFRFSVPKLLVTAEGIVIRCGKQTLVLPVDNIVRSYRLSEVAIQQIGSHNYLVHDERQLELVSLAQILGLPEYEEQDRFVVIIQSRTKFAAFTITELLRNQEVVVKNFSKPLFRVRHSAGATIMADGSIALILNPEDLIDSVLNGRGRALPANLTNPAPAVAVAATTKILLVDDSLTTRTLEKNILEAAGYKVQLARTGVEALDCMRNASYDLVIADIEMPEMDGLTLTRTIRLDSKLSATPVIIVSSLDSAQHKTNGMEAGADAYMVKSRFDQDYLLATVRQLV